MSGGRKSAKMNRTKEKPVARTEDSKKGKRMFKPKIEDEVTVPGADTLQKETRTQHSQKSGSKKSEKQPVKRETLKRKRQDEKAASSPSKSGDSNDSSLKEEETDSIPRKVRVGLTSQADNDSKANRKRATKTECNISSKQKHATIKSEESTVGIKVSSPSFSGNVNETDIENAVKAITKLLKSKLEARKELLDESHPIFMQVTCIRIPQTSTRRIRVLLPHSVVSKDDEVALFVKDLKVGRRVDYEPTIEHYRDLLEQHGCTRIKDIIPMNRVKTEYDQFELKRKLVGSYDVFLADGRIAGHLSHLLGRIFTKRRKLPTSIRMDSSDLKREINYGLRKSSMQIHSFGDTHLLQIANFSMKTKEIVRNVVATCKQLETMYPGGWNNIRSIRLKSSQSLAIPIYLTLKKKNLVPMPVVPPKRPKAYRNVEGELTTLPGTATVMVTPEGDVALDHEIDISEEDSVENIKPIDRKKILRKKIMKKKT